MESDRAVRNVRERQSAWAVEKRPREPQISEVGLERAPSMSNTDTPDLDIYDVGVSDFQTQVIDASRKRPILVDFWASWCGPCRMLSPILDRVVERHRGDVALAKVNADEEPELAARYGVRGLPTVKLFHDGEAVAEFVGARPEGAVESFLAPHLPDPAADVVATADELARSGQRDAAVEQLEAALGDQPENAAVATALGEHYLARGETERARALYNSLPATVQTEGPARVLAARLQFAEALAHAPPPSDLSSRAGHDAEALVALAAYDVMAGHYDSAAERLFSALQTGGSGREGARRALLDLMEIVGSGDSRAVAWRRKLAQLLY